MYGLVQISNFDAEIVESERAHSCSLNRVPTLDNAVVGEGQSRPGKWERPSWPGTRLPSRWGVLGGNLRVWKEKEVQLRF